MFSDLVGSTALSARMDPEDLREIISAYQKCVAETVRSFGGFVANYMGDGVLVYFGYPKAHEDDAERAVRAGLELIAAVTALKTSVSLQTRVGIATGLVVVGDPAFQRLSRSNRPSPHRPSGAPVGRSFTGLCRGRDRQVSTDGGAFGSYSTRAAQSFASFLLAATLRDWVSRPRSRPCNALEVLGPEVLKFKQVAEQFSRAEGRFEALHPGGVTELIGREEELNLLLRRWSKGAATITNARLQGVAEPGHCRHC
jgi:hypothetical protein